MTAGNGAPSGASGDAGNGAPGGQQGAVTPEQLTKLRAELKQELQAEQNQALSGALTARFARLEEKLLGLIPQGLAGAQPAGGTGASGAAAGGVKKDEPSDQIARLESEVKTHKEQLALERKRMALKESLTGLGCRDPNIALQLLLPRKDIVSRPDSNGELQWFADVKGPYGDVTQVPLGEGLRQFLKEHAVLSPAVGGAGSGASGARATGAGDVAVPGAGKSINELTPEEAEAMPIGDLNNLVQRARGRKVGW